MVVVAEGAHMPEGEIVTIDANAGGEVRLGGIGERVAAKLQKPPARKPAPAPSATFSAAARPPRIDRILGMRFGVMAVKLADEGNFGSMVSYQAYHVDSVPIEEAVHQLRLVEPQSELVLAAKAVGICFGD